jgi:hypothetical protein
LSNAQKVACVDAAKEMLRILQASEANDYVGSATSDKSWFQPTTTSSKMFARSAVDVILRTHQAVGAKQTMITVFFTAKKLLVFDILLRGGTFNQLYFIKNTFPNLKAANLNSRCQKTGSTFWVHRDNFMCHNGSKITSKLRRNIFPEYRTCPIHQI